ncbi:hypothetical protein AAVH_11255 [Aphelenchoides avenae]|nr:hypothetical protein AAVH_11255 [Aphelenchus avenae]
MPLRPTRQSNATATRAAAASSLTYVDSGTSAAYNTTSASVASYCTSLQPSATSSLVPYSQSYGRSQMPTIHVPFATSTSPQFPPGQANTSTLSPEIANLGIGLAAEPKKCYGWMKMSTTTGEQITLFDEVLSLKIEDMALLYLDGMGPFDKQDFEKYALPYSPPSQLTKTPTSTNAKTSVVRRPLGDIKNRLVTSSNHTVVKPQRRSMELMPPPAKCTRLVRT